MKIQKDYPGLCPEYTPAGTFRWRVRVFGQTSKKIGLPRGMTQSDPDFDEAYNAARNGKKFTPKPAHKVGAASLDALRLAYVAAMKIMVAAGQLDSKTLAGRERGLRQACDVKKGRVRIGQMNADLPDAAFSSIIDSFGARTGAAETCRKALRAAYKWGETRGYPTDSKVFNLRSVHIEGGGAPAWTAEDVEKFLTRHQPGTMARLWFALAYDSHGRIGDMHWLGRGNEKHHNGERHLDWQPRKSGSAFVSLPFGKMLAAELEHHAIRETYLVTEHGRPFSSPGSLDNKVRHWIIEAGLCTDARDEAGNPIYKGKGKRMIVRKTATRSQHGIRKGVAELMAERGATEYELMAMFGWTQTKTASTYTRNFRRREAARIASMRMS